MGKKRARVSCHIDRHPNAWDGKRGPGKGIRDKRRNEIGWVYFIAASGTGTIKIGFSSESPEKRLRNLQTANPYSLSIIGRVPGSRRDEQRYHAQFGDYHVRGEWFRDEGELRLFLDTFVAGVF